jgi:protein-S-isoprenylcysteine O-methyltransferase Ste14
MRKKRTTLNPLHAEKSTTLVTGGCYARASNPIYLGMSGLQLAFLAVGSLIEYYCTVVYAGGCQIKH